MQSPFKGVRLNFEDKSAVISDQAQQASFYNALVRSVFPNGDLCPPEKPSYIKTASVPKWNKGDVTIIDHLWDVKLHCETLLVRGQLTTGAEHMSVLLESIQVPSMRDWIKHNLSQCSTPAVLMHYLLRAFHNAFSERQALSELERLPVFASVEQLNTAFDRLAVQITPTFLTEHMKSHFYLCRVPAHVRTAGKLDHLLSNGWSFSRLQQEATRLDSEPDLSQPPAVRFREPSPAPLVHAVPAAPAVPDGMDVDAIVQQAVNSAVNALGFGARGGKGGARGGKGGARGGGRQPARGRGGKGAESAPPDTSCYRCGGTGHWAWQCATPKN